MLKYWCSLVGRFFFWLGYLFRIIVFRDCRIGFLVVFLRIFWICGLDIDKKFIEWIFFIFWFVFFGRCFWGRYFLERVSVRYNFGLCSYVIFILYCISCNIRRCSCFGVVVRGFLVIIFKGLWFVYKVIFGYKCIDCFFLC